MRRLLLSLSSFQVGYSLIALSKANSPYVIIATSSYWRARCRHREREVGVINRDTFPEESPLRFQ